MRKRMLSRIALLAAMILLLLACAPAVLAESAPKLNTYQKALSWVKKNHPAELDLGSVRFKPRELKNIRDNMAEGGVLHFSTAWCGTTITDLDTRIDLNGSKNSVTEADVEALISLCPDLEWIRFSAHRNLSNKIMIPMTEKYPDIRFVWLLTLNRTHVLPTDATAYSTFNEPLSDYKLRSADLELLRYVPDLRALDLGHNKITTLDWLKYCPDLECLILSDNLVEDLTLIGNLTRLQYLELFMNYKITDLSPLANCTDLLDLNLSSNDKVTDLSPLDALPKLERMWGNRMFGLSEEEKARFIAAQPNVLTSFTRSHDTANDWRKHERIKHYLWCFKNKTWVPFDQPLPKR
ncbi:MAG: leucine-rich repeat domain-containing protein [Clostridia bacterium]|nr:leucine-rich repeat domain-containing protein [Clostridia bacterium]